ncbi:MAG: tetratricopeptide repeat protein [Planctomycetota bacterium]
MPASPASGSSLRPPRSLLRHSRLLQVVFLLGLPAAAAAVWYAPGLLFDFHLQRISACIQQLQFDVADQQLQPLLKDHPQAPQPLLLLLSLQRQRDEFAAARQTLEKLRSMKVDSRRLFDEENLLLAKTADSRASEARLSALLTSPDFLPGDVCDAFTTWLRGFSRLEAAEILIRTWKSDLPDDYRAWAQHGILYAMQVRPTDAVRELSHAVELGDLRASTQAHLGRSLLDLDRLDEALAAFSLACTRQPDSAENWMWKAKTLRLKGDNAGCITALRQCLICDPADFDAMLMLGLAERDTGQLEQARSRLAAFLEDWPEDQGALAAWIRILNVADQPAEIARCETSWEAASAKVQHMEGLLAKLQQQPDNNAIRCEAGCLAMTHQNRRAGEQLLFAVLRVEPENQQARAALTDYLEKRRRRLNAAK